MQMKLQSKRPDESIYDEDFNVFYSAYKNIFNLQGNIHQNLLNLRETYDNSVEQVFNCIVRNTVSHEGIWMCISPLGVLKSSYF